MVMCYGPPVSLLVLACLPFSALALPNVLNAKLPSLAERLWRTAPLSKRTAGVDRNPNGSTFVWLPQDEYSGQNFFDKWDFFTAADPTNGQVNYVNRSYAFQQNLTYVTSDGVVIMKADDVMWLPQGVFRNSVRISSTTQYNTGLFILDLNQAPWGCGIWPAFWTVGTEWPTDGEIDIIEGVHDNEHNQVAWHTAAGCTLDPNAHYTGTIGTISGQNNTNCDASVNSNSGCDVTEWSRASYGPYFDSQGGGVFALKWDENSIAVWSFYRAAIPSDIVAGTPIPDSWGYPSAVLESSRCDIPKYFANHSIVFDITFCGDWAGNSYATSGCPGTCADRLMDPSNFKNATWSINTLKVYRKQLLTGVVVKSAGRQRTHCRWTTWLSVGLLMTLCTIMS